VAIVRPSIVAGLAYGPVQGYSGNAAGFTSAAIAFASGTALLFQLITCLVQFTIADLLCLLLAMYVTVCCVLVSMRLSCWHASLCDCLLRL
jgi:hypothetical protein